MNVAWRPWKPLDITGTLGMEAPEGLWLVETLQAPCGGPGSIQANCANLFFDDYRNHKRNSLMYGHQCFA